MKVAIEIGEYLKKNRERAGLNASQMAKKMKCTPGYIYHVEHDLALPRATLLKRYLKAAKLDPKEFKAHVAKVVTSKLERMGV